MQTEEPFWLKEAYNEAIGAMDVGILMRTNYAVKIIQEYIEMNWRNIDNTSFLDYGGGTGAFVRMMRDQGYNFYRQDKYSENIFCRFFDLEDISKNARQFNLITAFEVVEHFTTPQTEFANLFKMTDTIWFTTEIQPSDVKPEDWWYISSDGGQHISFYSIKALKNIADQHQAIFRTNGANTHLFSKKKKHADNFDKLINTKRGILNKMYHKFIRPVKLNRKSLIKDDFAYVVSKLNHNHEV